MKRLKSAQYKIWTYIETGKIQKEIFKWKRLNPSTIFLKKKNRRKPNWKESEYCIQIKFRNERLVMQTNGKA